MKSLEQKLWRNMYVLAADQLANAFMISMAVIIPYWNSLGLDQANIYQLQAGFLLAVVVLEVPSGYFADLFGRRKSITIGQVLITIAWVGYVFADSFASLFAVEILLGIGLSLKTGADSAIRVDSLKYLKRENENLSIHGRMTAIAAWGEGVAGLIGGALAVISLSAPIIGHAVWAVATLAIPFLLTDVPKQAQVAESTSHPWRDLGEIVQDSLRTNKSIKWLILYGAAINSLTYTAVWLMQPYYSEIGIEVGFTFGVLWAIKHLFLGGFLWNSHRIKNFFGLQQTLIALPVIGVMVYLVLGIGYSLWVLPVFIGFEFIRGVQRPVIEDEVNKLVLSDDRRATVLSVQGLVGRLLMATLGLVMGAASDAFGIRGAFLFSAALYAPICFVAALGLFRSHNSFTLKRR